MPSMDPRDFMPKQRPEMNYLGRAGTLCPLSEAWCDALFVEHIDRAEPVYERNPLMGVTSVHDIDNEYLLMRELGVTLGGLAEFYKTHNIETTWVVSGSAFVDGRRRIIEMWHTSESGGWQMQYATN